jgi:hypothetical protein
MVLWRLSFSLLRIFTAEYAESAEEEDINRYGRKGRYGVGVAQFGRRRAAAWETERARDPKNLMRIP